MIIFRDRNEVDTRHTIKVDSYYSHSVAVQLNEDGTYDRVTYMKDDVRTYNNEVIIDATEKEIKQYRKTYNQIEVGDIIKIISGKKMKGETKTVSSTYWFRPEGTFGVRDVEYLKFTDGTKVQKAHCVMI